MKLDSNSKARDIAINKALEEYERYKEELDTLGIMAVVNMREPSYRKRMYIYNVQHKTVISEHHVSHGINSTNPNDKAYAISFSNVPGSLKSSLGAMKTGEIYHGKHGRSLRLEGLEEQNSNVRRRYIVIHKADYVTDNFILKNKRAGHSNGCLAVDPAVVDSVIDNLKGGTFVYVYY